MKTVIKVRPRRKSENEKGEGLKSWGEKAESVVSVETISSFCQVKFGVALPNQLVSLR